MAWLVAVDGELTGRRFSLDAPCLVGRGPYNHVVLDDTRISRQHAKISPEPGGHVVYDLNSANGTFVNDVQVKRQKLAPNDVVRFGPFSFTLRVGGARAHRSRTKVGKFMRGAHPGRRRAAVEDRRVARRFACRPTRARRTIWPSSRTPIASCARSTPSCSRSRPRSTQGELFERILRNLLELFPAAEAVAIYLREATVGHDGAAQGDAPRRGRRRRCRRCRGCSTRRSCTRGAPSCRRRWRSGAKGAGGLSMHAPMIFGNDVQGVLHVRGGETGLIAVQPERPRSAHRPGVAGGDGAAERAHARRVAQAAAAAAGSPARRADPEVASCRSSCRRWRGSSSSPSIGPPTRSAATSTTCSGSTSERIGVFIGDVSGKGVSAALLMARISSDLRVAALAEPSPARAISRVNRAVLERQQHDIFVTGIYLTLDVATRRDDAGQRRPSAAVHPPQARGELVRVEGGSGTAIGIFDEARLRADRAATRAGRHARSVHRRRARGHQRARRAVRLRAARRRRCRRAARARRSSPSGCSAICASTSAMRRSTTT